MTICINFYNVTDCFNRMFDCSIRVYRSFCKLDDRAQQAFGRAWALPGMPLATPPFETKLSCVLHVSVFILLSDYSYFMLVDSL